MHLIRALIVLGSTNVMAQAAAHSWAVHLVKKDGTAYSKDEALSLAQAMNINYVDQIGGIDGHFLFESTVASGLQKRSNVEQGFDESNAFKWYEYQKPLNRKLRSVYKRVVRLDTGDVEDEEDVDNGRFLDPLFQQQWYLINDGENALQKGNDINVAKVWDQGIIGTGVTVAILDDGVDSNHSDLASKWSRLSSYDFEARTNEALPRTPEELHGTRCAGQIVSEQNNGVCGVGVAYGAKFSAERVIFPSASDATEAQAFNFAWDVNDIYTSSWGPGDDGKSVDGPKTLGQKALAAGVSRGRSGKGSIFVFASGNGGEQGDNCNFDGYANSIYTTAIGAINHIDGLPAYAELCSAHLAVTYSGGKGRSIATTEPNNKCTLRHSGTSASAPIAAGMIALMLQARPELGWRDVQQIIVDTAVKNDPLDPDWQTNGAGKHVSHKYGFGKMNALLLVEKSRTHDLLPRHGQTFSKESGSGTGIIPLSGLEAGLIDTIYIDGADLRQSGLASLEQVQVAIKIQHPERRQLEISLTSPDGTVSNLATRRVNDDSADGFDWTFMTVRNWGEAGAGRWKLHVHDFRTKSSRLSEDAMTKHGELLSWKIIMHGTCSASDTELVPGSDGSIVKVCKTVSTVQTDNDRRVNAILGFVIISCMLLIVIFFVVVKRIFGSRKGSGFHPIQAEDIESPLKYDLESPLPQNGDSFKFFRTSKTSPLVHGPPVLKSKKVGVKFFGQSTGLMTRTLSSDGVRVPMRRVEGRDPLLKSTSLSCLTDSRSGLVVNCTEEAVVEVVVKKTE